MLLLIIIVQSEDRWTDTETDADMQLINRIPNKVNSCSGPKDKARLMYLGVLKSVIFLLLYCLSETSLRVCCILWKISETSGMVVFYLHHMFRIESATISIVSDDTFSV